MPAPSAAELLVAFINTLDIDAGNDELASDDSWQRWVRARQLGAPGDRAVAATLRDALRAAAGGGVAPDVTVPVSVGVVGGVPTATAHDTPGALALAALDLQATGAWPRLKLCADETCRWAFLDESRNRSRAWCSMDVCGNRAKVRSFRSRARQPSD